MISCSVMAKCLEPSTEHDKRYLRVVRLLRVFKLSRYSRAMQLLLNVFKEERLSLFAAFSVLFIIMLVAACAMYTLEKDVQPEHFSSIPQAMWWALVTLTTVGYGDVTPVTDLGRLFGGLITIVGIGVVALPADILASGFSEQLSRRRQFFNWRWIRHLKMAALPRSPNRCYNGFGLSWALVIPKQPYCVS